MPAGANGLPDPAAREEFSTQVGGLVDLEIGPGGDLYYVDVIEGSIHHISYDPSGNQPPSAMAHADHDRRTRAVGGAVPRRHVDRPNGDPLTYAWDLDGDGAFDDSTAANPTQHVHACSGRSRSDCSVTDSHNASNIASVVINVGGGAGAPVPMIGVQRRRTGSRGRRSTSPASRPMPRTGTIPANKLSWNISLFHCPDGVTCHEHPQSAVTGAGGTFIAPDHEYYAYLRFTLTATDSEGNTGIVSRDLQPQTRTLDVAVEPGGCDARPERRSRGGAVRPHRDPQLHEHDQRARSPR